MVANVFEPTSTTDVIGYGRQMLSKFPGDNNTREFKSIFKLFEKYP